MFALYRNVSYIMMSVKNENEFNVNVNVNRTLLSVTTHYSILQSVCLHALNNPIIIGFRQLSDYSNGHVNSTL